LAPGLLPSPSRPNSMVLELRVGMPPAGCDQPARRGRHRLHVADGSAPLGEAPADGSETVNDLDARRTIVEPDRSRRSPTSSGRRPSRSRRPARPRIAITRALAERRAAVGQRADDDTPSGRLVTIPAAASRRRSSRTIGSASTANGRSPGQARHSTGLPRLAEKDYQSARLNASSPRG